MDYHVHTEFIWKLLFRIRAFKSDVFHMQIRILLSVSNRIHMFSLLIPFFDQTDCVLTQAVLSSSPHSTSSASG